MNQPDKTNLLVSQFVGRCACDEEEAIRRVLGDRHFIRGAY